MLTWQTVETLATEAGYPRKTIRMWRERGVAAKARIAIYAHAKGAFDITEFDTLPLAKRDAA